MSAVIDIAKDIAESVRKHRLHVEISSDEYCVSVDVYADPFQYIVTLWCDTKAEAERVVALAKSEAAATSPI